MPRGVKILFPLKSVAKYSLALMRLVFHLRYFDCLDYEFPSFQRFEFLEKFNINSDRLMFLHLFLNSSVLESYITPLMTVTLASLEQSLYVIVRDLKLTT